MKLPLQIFARYIQKASETFGVTSTREIYQKAIDILNDRQAKIMCLKFAEVERQLGEIDRARAIYAYCSQFADPRVKKCSPFPIPICFCFFL